MAEIRFKNVSKRFGDVEVVNGLDLMIHDGEFFTFVGPSGCGKSTILNMIAGLEDVTGGSLLFDDRVVNSLSPKDRDVAMVFQSYALYPHMSVYENIAFPLRMKKEKNGVIDKEVRRVASLLGIAGFLLRKPRELSGGQRQRVALARAIVRRPKVFLMDEPLSNLDARLRMETRAELKKLHRELEITTIYVTHDQAEALGLSDRIAVLKDGVVQQVGTPQEVYAKPENMFVGGFIGSPPMNFIPCRVLKKAPLEIDCFGFAIEPNVAPPSGEGSLILGVRPEDVHVTSERPAEGLEVTVSVTEPAGSFAWIDVVQDGVRLKGLSRQIRDLVPGGKAYASFPRQAAMVFDAATGKRLC
ncbi:MAG TPA: ABC transporter ATP-binding protein [Nitrospirota bacterium]|nr:ABC transporter ATP-binding protein [Nitrospirota bacterium]